jgi:hypothetical protein
MMTFLVQLHHTVFQLKIAPRVKNNTSNLLSIEYRCCFCGSREYSMSYCVCLIDSFLLGLEGEHIPAIGGDDFFSISFRSIFEFVPHTKLTA